MFYLTTLNCTLNSIDKSFPIRVSKSVTKAVILNNHTPCYKQVIRNSCRLERITYFSNAKPKSYQQLLFLMMAQTPTESHLTLHLLILGQ